MPDNWYVQSGGQQLGPMPLDSLREMQVAGKVQPSDYVWAEGWPQWRLAGEVAELGAAGVGGANQSSASASAPASPLLYQAPQARSPYASGLEYRGVVNQPVIATEGAIRALMRTRPWVMLWAVLLFIGAAFSALGVLGMLIMGAVDRDGEFLPFAAMFGVVYLLIAVFYLFAGLYLSRYFGAIGRTNRLRRPEDLESALTYQFRFWRLTGIGLATVIVVYLVILAGAVAFGLLS